MIENDVIVGISHVSSLLPCWRTYCKSLWSQMQIGKSHLCDYIRSWADRNRGGTTQQIQKNQLSLVWCWCSSHLDTAIAISIIWSDTRGSNSWPQPWQGCALPTELVSQNGGASRNRTEVHGFAIRCIATLPRRLYFQRFRALPRCVGCYFTDSENIVKQKTVLSCLFALF